MITWKNNGDQAAQKNPNHIIYNAPEKDDHQDQTGNQNNMKHKNEIGHQDAFKMLAVFFFHVTIWNAYSGL